MAIISALSDLARNIIKVLGTLCCKDVVINKSSLKHFYTNFKKKQGIQEKSSYKIIVNAVFVNPIKSFIILREYTMIKINVKTCQTEFLRF